MTTTDTDTAEVEQIRTVLADRVAAMRTATPTGSSLTMRHSS
jgi:hypothetical protein